MSLPLIELELITAIHLDYNRQQLLVVGAFSYFPIVNCKIHLHMLAKLAAMLFKHQVCTHKPSTMKDKQMSTLKDSQK